MYDRVCLGESTPRPRSETAEQFAALTVLEDLYFRFWRKEVHKLSISFLLELILGNEP
jgi:hypothetical protein